MGELNCCTSLAQPGTTSLIQPWHFGNGSNYFLLLLRNWKKRINSSKNDTMWSSFLKALIFSLPIRPTRFSYLEWIQVESNLHIYLVQHSFKLTHKRKVSKSEIGIINIDGSVCHSCAESIWLSPSPVHVKFEFAAPKSVVPLSYFIKIKIDEVVKILAKIFQFLYLTNNVLNVSKLKSWIHKSRPGLPRKYSFWEPDKKLIWIF